MFDIQDEISLAIVEKLEVKLLGSERAAVVRRDTENLDAYSAYLQGIHYLLAFTPEGYRRSRECLEDHLAYVCYMQGDKSLGDEILDILQSRARNSYVPPTFLAWIHLARGEPDAALARLQEAASGSDPWITFHRLTASAVDPRIDAFLKSLEM